MFATRESVRRRTSSEKPGRSPVVDYGSLAGLLLLFVLLTAWVRRPLPPKPAQAQAVAAAPETVAVEQHTAAAPVSGELAALVDNAKKRVDGIASSGRVLLGYPKTREATRAGLAMYFATLADDGLMEVGRRVVGALGLDHFFNIQLVGEAVVEINPRISTIVYQEDLNLPYLGLKRALGEIEPEELAAYAGRVRQTRRALRFFDQLEWDD